MIKKLFLLATVAILTFSCKSGNNNNAAEATDAQEVSAAAEAKTVESLLASADSLVDKDITVRGFVTHTCKHSGRRCFIVGEDQKTSLRVEAKGEIGGFNRELIGSELIIKGKLRENRLTKEYLDQYSEQLKEKGATAENGSAESCESEQKNIAAMIEWMKANNKDYYSTYYVDGESYEVVDEQQQ
jgi:hypothetical protein